MTIKIIIISKVKLKIQNNKILSIINLTYMVDNSH